MSPGTEYRYLGPAGEGFARLPAGVGAAMGSEYCVHLLPSPRRMAEVAEEASGRRAPLVLLTPYFRDSELKRTLPLFRSIPEGAEVDVAVNDWGALRMLRGLFPWLTLSIGRLLSGQKRCPRIGGSPFLTEEGRAWHGEGIFSSPRARGYLAAEYGVRRFHLDGLPWGRGTPMPEGGDVAGNAFFLHVPWAVVTVSDACPWIGGRSSGEISACPAPCREGAVALREPSMGAELVQKGKARFLATGDLAGDRAGSPGCHRVVYGSPP